VSAGDDGPTVPELVGAGSISTAAPEFATTFTADGRTLFFNRTSPDRSQLTLMESRLGDDGWTAPAPIAFSGPDWDIDPFVSPDGRRLYFSSNRPTSEADTVVDFNTWFVEILEEGYGEPQVLPEPLNTAASEVFVSITRAGAIFFSSTRDGVRRIYRGTLTDPEAPVELVPVDVNVGETGAGNPLVDAEERFLVFVVNVAGGQGGADLYVSRRGPDGWSPAEPLAGVNSSFSDFAPGLSRDGSLLYFTSERPGVVPEWPAGERPPGDIYRILVEAVGLPR
jgi:Tol biopolymer transport system component